MNKYMISIIVSMFLLTGCSDETKETNTNTMKKPIISKNEKTETNKEKNEKNEKKPFNALDAMKDSAKKGMEMYENAQK